MKKNKFSMLISIENIIGLLCVMISPIIMFNDNFSENSYIFLWSVSALSNVLKTINNLRIVLFIGLAVSYLWCIISNYKNKRNCFWSIIPMLYTILCLITLFNVEIQYQKYIMTGIILFALIIDFITDLNTNTLCVKKIILLIFFSIIIIIGYIFNIAICYYIIPCIMQIFYNKKDKKNKIVDILNSILGLLMILLLLINMAYVIYYANKLYKIYNDSLETANEIKSQIDNVNISTEPLIPVRNGEKYGYINSKGKLVVECEYDAFAYMQISDEQNYYIGYKDNKYYVIYSNGQILYVSENIIPFTFYTGYIKENFEEMGEDKIVVAEYMVNEVLANKVLSKEDSEKIENLESTVYNSWNIFNSSLIYTEEDTISANDNIVYKFSKSDRENNSYNVYVKTVEKENNNDAVWYIKGSDILVLKNNEITHQYEDVNIILKIYNDGLTELNTISDEYIPYYNFKENICGLFNDSFEKILEIKGKYQILDYFDDNYLLIRNYNDINNIKEEIIDLNGNIMLSAKGINENSIGFLIKKENGKVVYADKNFNIMSNEYDGIFELSYNQEVFVCANIEMDKTISICLIDKNGNESIPLKYDYIEKIEINKIDIEKIMNVEYSLPDSNNYDYINDYYNCDF